VVDAVGAAVLALMVAGWVLGHGLGLAVAAARWGGQAGMPPRLAGVWAGAALVAAAVGACLVVAQRLAQRAG
jgi:hypothetical protein